MIRRTNAVLAIMAANLIASGHSVSRSSSLGPAWDFPSFQLSSRSYQMSAIERYRGRNQRQRRRRTRRTRR
jgi:hypothetical protein